uniref:GerAB/ArcD/ProY family transporter n=1 Tax=Paenibacillus terrae TaxID=159743 RepID=UPI0011A9AEC9|nr:GerAB/ArcD/ProY family transporter [Paenibacillus terrae]
MNPSNEELKISMPQYFVLQMMVFGAISFHVYPWLVLQSTTQSYWIPILIWMLLGLLGAWLFSRVLALHQGKDAYTITKLVLGWPGVILFIVPLLWFMWSAMVIIVRAHSEIISMTILHSTPQWFLDGMIFIGVFLAFGGIGSIIRASVLFLLISFPLSVGLVLLGFGDLDFNLGKPWLYTNGDFLTSPKFYTTSFIWAGYLYYAACGRYAKQPKKLWRPYTVAALCFLPLLAASVYQPALTFSPEMSRILTLPYISKMDSVSYYWLVIENLTAVFIVSSILYLFLLLALILNCIVTAIRAVFPSWNEKLLYVLAGITAYAAIRLIPSWEWIERAVEWDTVLRLYLMYGFPMAVLVKSFISNKMRARQ